jgi:hypothetical protein
MRPRKLSLKTRIGVPKPKLSPNQLLLRGGSLNFVRRNRRSDSHPTTVRPLCRGPGTTNEPSTRQFGWRRKAVRVFRLRGVPHVLGIYSFDASVALCTHDDRVPGNTVQNIIDQLAGRAVTLPRDVVCVLKEAEDAPPPRDQTPLEESVLL